MQWGFRYHHLARVEHRRHAPVNSCATRASSSKTLARMVRMAIFAFSHDVRWGPALVAFSSWGLHHRSSSTRAISTLHTVGCQMQRSSVILAPVIIVQHGYHRPQSRDVCPSATECNGVLPWLLFKLTAALRSSSTRAIATLPL